MDVLKAGFKYNITICSTKIEIIQSRTYDCEQYLPPNKVEITLYYNVQSQATNNWISRINKAVHHRCRSFKIS